MADEIRIYMRLSGVKTGKINGASEARGRKDWIELDTWNWYMRRNDKGDAEPSVFSFDKPMDRATTAMLSAMRSGDTLSANVVVEDASADLFEFEMELTKIRILSYELDARVREGKTITLEVGDSWTFDYDTIVFRYRPDQQSGWIESHDLKRPTGASKEPPDTARKKMVALARDINNMKTLEEIWQDIKAEHEKRRAPLPTVK